MASRPDMLVLPRICGEIRVRKVANFGCGGVTDWFRKASAMVLLCRKGAIVCLTKYTFTVILRSPQVSGDPADHVKRHEGHSGTAWL